MLRKFLLSVCLVTLTSALAGCGGGNGGSEGSDTTPDDSVTDMQQEDGTVPDSVDGDVKDTVTPPDSVDNDQVGDSVEPDESEPDELEDECESTEDCAAMNIVAGVCQSVVCNLETRKCVTESLADGTVCDDGNACSDGDVCVAGECAGTVDPLCCGDGVCAEGEVCDTCPADCGECEALCGDILTCQGQCDSEECADACVLTASEPEQAKYQAVVTCLETACPTWDQQCVSDAITGGDCVDEYSACGFRCGNGVCGTEEDCNSCSADCGACPAVLCSDLVNQVVQCADAACIESATQVATPAAALLFEPVAACIETACPASYPWALSDCFGQAASGPCSEVWGNCMVDSGSCGDGFCHQSEDCDSCPADCGVCPFCGDGTCGFLENCKECAGDCGECAADSCLFNCGTTAPAGCGCAEDCVAAGTCCADYDLACVSSSCAEHCYEQAPGGCYCDIACLDYGDCCYDYMNYCEEVCGDGTCTPGEGCTSCAQDCGECDPCGDGTCAEDESCETCPDDCGPCAPVCGNGSCDGDENCGNCEADCGACPADSCQGRCDQLAPSGCSCTADCQTVGNCCADSSFQCGDSCVGHCGNMSGSGNCYCDEVCLDYGDCCTDYESACVPQ